MEITLNCTSLYQPVIACSNYFDNSSHYNNYFLLSSWTLYYIFFLLFLSQTSLFWWGWFFVELIDIPFLPNTCQSNLPLFLKWLGFCSGVVKAIWLNKSLIFSLYTLQLRTYFLPNSCNHMPMKLRVLQNDLI